MTRLNCAIYTRKSSDEGLEQGFNSLDAQREAGEAYIRSQAAEGWRLVPARYDDGGYSGGTMERPALKNLLADVDAGRIDIVVVYKIDRLTRSLPDFARIVERFDARGTSFVSVTQAFNTTSSMGRLTLNVLLSFAQFEREVTGERIRDKIAASKAKGMWMGGALPLGYDRPLPGTRTLVVNDAEAATVRHIFDRYLALGSVHRLERELADAGVRSKRWTTSTGRGLGGVPFSRGALFHLLRNRLYLGQIVHKELVHDGAHQGIVDPVVFEAAAAQLDGSSRRNERAAASRVATASLAGRIVDEAGEPMSPAFSYGRGGRVYRYYVTTSLQQGHRPPRDGRIRRVPAAAIEALISERLAELSPGAGLDELVGVVVAADGIEIRLPPAPTRRLAGSASSSLSLSRDHDGHQRVKIEVALPLRGGRRSVSPGRSDADRDLKLVAALRRAHALCVRDRSGAPLIDAAPVSPYDRKLLRLAFLAPDIQRAILDGRQPPHVNLEYLMGADLALSWVEQRRILGWNRVPC